MSWEQLALTSLLQLVFVTLPVILHMERRLSKLEVKVDMLWKLAVNGHGKEGE